MSGERGRAWRRRFARLMLVLVAAFVGLGLAEVFVRVFDPLGVSHYRDMQRYLVEFCEHPGPPRILRQPANSEMEFRDFSIRTNELGLRGAPVPAKKAPGERRILWLGDSVVLGWGAQEQDLFVTRVAEDLSKGERRVSCVNAGHNQYDTTQEAALLDELGERIAPDLVLLVYVVNDVDPTIRVWNAFVEQSSGPPPSTWQRVWGWTRSEAFRGLNGIWTFLQQRDAELATATAAMQGTDSSGSGQAGAKQGAGAGPGSGQGAPEDREGWERSKAALLRIRDWCAKRKIPFAVLDHTLPPAEGRRAEVPGLVDFLAKSGIRRFDFALSVEERADPKLRHSASDPHCNAQGHTLLLAKAKQALAELGFKP